MTQRPSGSLSQTVMPMTLTSGASVTSTAGGGEVRRVEDAVRRVEEPLLRTVVVPEAPQLPLPRLLEVILRPEVGEGDHKEGEQQPDPLMLSA